MMLYLARAFKFNQATINKKQVWYTDSISLDEIKEGNKPNDCITLSFLQGSTLYIGFTELESGEKKETSFVTTSCIVNVATILTINS